MTDGPDAARIRAVVVDDAVAGSTAVLVPFVAALIALALVQYGLSFVRRYYAGRLSLDVQHDLRRRVFDAVTRLDGERQDALRTGQVASRAITDLQLLQGLLSMVPFTLGTASLVVTSVAAMLWLVYLVPSWVRDSQFSASERNAIRLQQTLRVLAETAEVPEAVRLEATSREVAAQRKLLKQLEARTKATAEAAARVELAEADRGPVDEGERRPAERRGDHGRAHRRPLLAAAAHGEREGRRGCDREGQRHEPAAGLEAVLEPAEVREGGAHPGQRARDERQRAAGGGVRPEPSTAGDRAAGSPAEGSPSWLQLMVEAENAPVGSERGRRAADRLVPAPAGPGGPTG